MSEVSGVQVEELLAKYTRAAPRYTSYPTVLDWAPGFDPATYGDLLRSAAQIDAPLSLYTHIPYCPERCLFCGCNVVITRKRERISEYVDCLLSELKAFQEAGLGNRSMHQLHWGGGTPTHLSEAEIERLFVATRDTFQFTEDAEISIEVDPRVTSKPQVELLGRLGFRRISMGVQDCDPEVQADIKRIQPYEMTRDVVETARAAGFEAVNIDLIYGLPFQTEERFAASVERVLQLRPDRLALFHYAHVPWIKKHQEAMTLEAMPDAGEKLRIFLRASSMLRAAGYETVGLDHFALPQDELVEARDAGALQRNFMGYTTRRATDLVPLGVSSIGELDGCYVQNDPVEASYQSQIREKGVACSRGYRLTDEDQLRRDVIHGLMCNGVLKKSEIETKHGIDFDQHFATELAELGPLEEDGLVELSSSTLHLTTLGNLLMRNVALVFDSYLRERSDGDGSATFSKTL